MYTQNKPFCFTFFLYDSCFSVTYRTFLVIRFIQFSTRSDVQVSESCPFSAVFFFVLEMKTKNGCGFLPPPPLCRISGPKVQFYSAVVIPFQSFQSDHAVSPGTLYRCMHFMQAVPFNVNQLIVCTVMA